MRHAKSCFKKGINWSYAEPPPFHNNMYGLHVKKKARVKPKNMRIKALVLSDYSIFELCNFVKGLGLERYNITMVGERIRREPWGETKSWKEKGKVWKKLQKGGITSFM